MGRKETEREVETGEETQVYVQHNNFVIASYLEFVNYISFLMSYEQCKIDRAGEQGTSV
jgi:hypothetical protein